MAQEDFCFIYYDGDAARDKAHMTRLQRGAYDDFISAQRKKGHLTIDDVKRVLSKDFEECWPALEWILLKDDEEKYYISWVERSVEKTRANSKKNKDRIEEYWRKVNAGEIVPRYKNGITKPIPRNNHGIIPEEQYIDGDGKGIHVLEGGTGETNFSGIVPDMVNQFTSENKDYPTDQDVDFPAVRCIAQKISKWISLKGDITIPKNSLAIKVRWGELIIHIHAESHFSKYSLSQINKHFQSIAQSFSNGGTKTDRANSSGKLGTSEARTTALKNWGLSSGEPVPGVDQGG